MAARNLTKTEWHEYSIGRTNFGVEMELLFTCCRKTANLNDHQRQIEIASKGFDDAVFLGLVRKHKVAPLVFLNLSRHNPGTFSNQLIQGLKSEYERNAQRALEMWALVSQIVFENQNVQLAIFKGLENSLRIFGDISTRDAGDVDFLCSRPDLNKFCLYLNQSGWRLKEESKGRAFNPSPLNANIKDLEFLKPGHPRIEVHFRLTINPLEFRGIESDYRTAKSKVNQGLTTLTDELLFVYLCVHGFRHGWERLKWLFDLPSFIEGRSLNWDLVWSISQNNGAVIPLQQALLLCRSLFGTPIDERILNRFKRPPRKIYWDHISDCISGQTSVVITPHPRSIRKNTLLAFLACDSFRIKLGLLAILILPTQRDYDFLPLPAYLRWLYVCLRPLLLLYRTFVPRLSLRLPIRRSD